MRLLAKRLSAVGFWVALMLLLALWLVGCNGSTHHALDCIPETYCTAGCPVCDQPPCDIKTTGDDDDDPSNGDDPRPGDDDDDDPDNGDDDDDDDSSGDSDEEDEG